MAFELLAEGRMVRTFEVELATDGNPDWWASDDVRVLSGENLAVRCNDLVPPTLTNGLAGLFRQTDEAVIGGDLYQETFRPQFHFTVRRGWNNDPNGLVYFNGDWHMFFQKIPYGLAVGDFRYMHWGHAVSTDLFHWTELPPAIYPLKSGIFSGGAFVDYGNKSGLGKGKEDVLIASYTGAGECIAVGTGRALELKDLPENPVLKHKGRDPKIIRYEPQNKWIMIVYEEGEQTGYAFYDSKDLKSWRRMFCIEGGHECPEFFEMPVEGESGRKWVIYGAERRLASGDSSEGHFLRSAYMVGSFDGEKFTPETGFIKGLSGPSFYAAQTFANAPEGRRILVAWLQGAIYPGMPFTQGMTVPTEMKLRRTPEGFRMFFNPVRELEKLRVRTQEGKNLNVTEANTLLAKAQGELLDIDLTVAPGGSGKFTLWVRGIAITWDAQAGELACRGTKAKLAPVDGAVGLRVLVDRCVLEIFVNDGITGMTFGGNIYSGTGAIKLEAGTDARAQSLRVSELKSIWEK
jgi:fructan beta-fructosidase